MDSKDLKNIASVYEAVYGGGKKEEKKDTRLVVTAADKKANTKAYQNYKAGNKAYKAADHLGEGKAESPEAEEKKDFLSELGVDRSGLDQLCLTCYSLLDLQTYLTTGEKETRAWTIKKGMTAPQAAGVIHTDFESGFIRANVVSYVDFVECGGFKQAKEKGILRQEGKDYIMVDGDVVEFLFNV